MTREAEMFAPYEYELALIDVIAGNMVLAATRLRRAFLANGYIAEILCGMTDPLPLAIWHGSNLAEAKIAQDYVRDYGGLWRSNAGAIAFLRWVHTHPKVMLERARILDLREALLRETISPAAGPCSMKISGSSKRWMRPSPWRSSSSVQTAAGS
ncbi:hypothetical protein IAE29_23205 [Ochrobactrum sp. S46]|nr:hypothetical protein [Ochrobactrum sp. S45]MBK0046234.1 hypothetical protein [Ochrobactrum sp. S46]